MILRLASNCFTALAGLVVFCGVAAAEPIRTEVFLTSAAGTRAFFLSSTGYESRVAAPAHVDYALFITELTAFLTKEILSDSAEEYGDSPLGSRWTRTMPNADSRFGDHCLKIVSRIGSAVSAPSLDSIGAQSPSPSASEYAVRSATTALALRQIWEAFANDVQGNRAAVSLRPKVSARRVGVHVTLHW